MIWWGIYRQQFWDSFDPEWLKMRKSLSKLVVFDMRWVSFWRIEPPTPWSKELRLVDRDQTRCIKTALYHGVGCSIFQDETQRILKTNFFDIDLVLKTFTGRLNSSDFLQFFKFPPTTRTLRHLNAFQVPNNKCSAIDRCMSAFNGLNIDLTTLRQLSYPRAKTLTRQRLNTWFFIIIF
jgi:hypothetical protein